MKVIFSALGGKLQSDVYDIWVTSPNLRWRIPYWDLDFKFWERVNTPPELTPAKMATFEHRGRFKLVDGHEYPVLELIDFG